MAAKQTPPGREYLHTIRAAPCPISPKLDRFITQESEVRFFKTMLNCSYTHSSTVVFINCCVCTVPICRGRVVAQLVEVLHHMTGVSGSKIFK